MDHVRAAELNKIAKNQVEFAKEYLEARKKAGIAKSSLDLLLAANLKSIRERKANVGYEMAKLMLCEDNSGARAFYEEELTETAKYKGLEKLIESLQSRISLEQSVMKYVHRGEHFGA